MSIRGPPTAQDHSQPRSSASVISVAKSQVQNPSVRSGRAVAPSAIRTVVTAPPWARDEPPSPHDHEPLSLLSRELSADHTRPSDVASYTSSARDDSIAGPSRWWTFTRHRPEAFSSNPLIQLQRPGSSGKGLPMRERSLSIAWLTSPIHRKLEDEGSPTLKGKQADRVESPEPIMSRRRPEEDNFHIDLPAPDPVATVNTLAQNKTPGWDSPWSPRPPPDLVARISSHRTHQQLPDMEVADEDDEKNLSPWAKRRKRYRAYILHNHYVPLLFRFINITFTSAALAMAVKIRHEEIKHNASGAVGSSPTVVIIFAPLTLVHVMAAVYLEYFGRPLGLWRTSAKLAHTLFEVVFICAWSAALALCFDNFFTSVIPCASMSSISWYSQLHRTTLIPGLSEIAGKGICHRQLALICLVGVGLIMYCYNLIISLFRIFEKVKYHPVPVT
ncbi:hypothetical protein BXZ70DRAFT_785508 [Cristinia sonorae]|uniref:Uncharacterized protein n=1 Tax=Cristinia sonorae TaxID=1940300 RepID=A0A8K0USZ3_9AGAR|nr:hypothetical protein BXZ70DRAFT_785508 [Cristinia sonorae]